MLWMWLACSGVALETDTAGHTAPEVVREPLTVGVIADPHLVGDAERLARLEAAIDHIEEVHAETPVDVVLIVGDIAWGAGLDEAMDALSGLSMPWVPIVGDNEGHFGDGEAFVDLFTPAWEDAASELDGFRMAQTPVTDAHGNTAWLTNVAFGLEGVHFYGLDWASRVDGMDGEFGELHDVDGGTWGWWREQLEADDPVDVGSVVSFSHIPMHLGPFDLDEMTQLQTELAPWLEAYDVNLSGHIHLDAEVEVEDGWMAWVTDATWDDEVRMRWVFAEPTDAGWTWSTRVDEVPFE